MSNLSDLLPAGAGAKSATFTASGTLSSGQTVALKADGTVEAVSSTSSVLGSQATFESAPIDYPAATYDSSNNKVVVAYQDQNNSNYGTAVVGTVSGSSISFGTPVVYESRESDYISITFDPSANKVVIASRRAVAANKGEAYVGTVSGTSISFVGSVKYGDDDTRYSAITYDSNAQKVVIAFQDFDYTSQGKAIVGTISSGTISFGTLATFEAAQVDHIAITYDSNSNKVVIVYRDVDNSEYGTAVVGTVSGTSISFGTPVVFITATALMNSVVYDSSNNKIVVCFRNETNSNYGTAIVGTVSGTSISFGTPVVFDSNDSRYISASYHSATNQIVVAYEDQTNNNGAYAIGSVSGTSIFFDSPSTYNSGVSRPVATTYDSTAEKIIIAYGDGTTAGAANTLTPSATNSADFVGITDQAIANTATGSVVVEGGVTEKLSGLTTGSTYYVQADGSLSTTSSSVTAGKALSATKLLLKG